MRMHARRVFLSSAELYAMSYQLNGTQFDFPGAAAAAATAGDNRLIMCAIWRREWRKVNSDRRDL